MTYPQMAMAFIFAITILNAIGGHGEYELKYGNVFHSITDCGILFSILYWGGFWA